MTQHQLCSDSFVLILVLQLSIINFYNRFDYASGYPVFTVFLWRYFSVPHRNSAKFCAYLKGGYVGRAISDFSRFLLLDHIL